MSSSDACDFGRYSRGKEFRCGEKVHSYIWSKSYDVVRGMCEEHAQFYISTRPRQTFKTKEEAKLYGLNLKLFGEDNG